MFERFHGDARQAVQVAHDEARRMRHGHIGPEHLLLGLAAGSGGPAAEALAASGLDESSVRERVAAASRADDPLDADTLKAIGIDLDAVRDAVEAAFGPGALDRQRERRCRPAAGHVPFTRDAKKSVELALREAIRLRHRGISSGHLLLGLLREGDNAATRVISGAGVDLAGLRDDVVRRLPTAA